MKNSLTFILLLIAAFSFAQNLLDHTSTWIEEIADFPVGAGYWTLQYNTITFEKDTFINGHSYFIPKYSITKNTYDSITDTLINETEFSYFASPKRDENGVIYSCCDSLNQETPLHDFNLTIGDTAISFCYLPQVVNFIDTVFVGNIPRKRFFFTNNNIDYLIEGIGTSRGFAWQPCPFGGIETIFELHCYGQQGQYLQLNSGTDCSNLVSVKESIELQLEYQIYPNPFMDYFAVQFENSIQKNLFVQIINLHGEIIFEKWIFSSNGAIRFDLGFLPSGIYFITFLNSTEFQTKKIVKINNRM